MCTSLYSIKLPSTVTEIGANAFQFCSNLSEVVFNEGLQKIGGVAFGYCTSLESITLPSTVTEIGRSAFGSCNRLREIVLNDGLQKIEQNAFWSCKLLLSITIPSTLTEIGSKWKSCISQLQQFDGLLASA